jgi:Flp pilus assembly pilin Flp
MKSILSVVSRVAFGGVLWVSARWRSNRGQTLAEYGPMVAVIAVIVVIAAVLLGANISNLFGSSAPKV